MGLSPDLIEPYQHRWAEFCYENEFCAGWIDMGLGKTVSTLMGLQEMYRDFEAAHTPSEWSYFRRPKAKRQGK